MDLPCNQFLARAAFAQQQGGGVGILGHQIDHMVQGLDRHGRADHRVVQQMPVVAVLDPQFPRLDDPVDQRRQLHELGRLGEILLGAELDRLDGVPDGPPAGHDHDRGPAPLLFQVPQHIEASHVRKLHVEQDHFRRKALGKHKRLPAGLRMCSVPVQRFEVMEQRQYYGPFVVYQQDPRHAARSAPFLTGSLVRTGRKPVAMMRYLILYQPFRRVNEINHGGIVRKSGEGSTRIVRYPGCRKSLKTR